MNFKVNNLYHPLMFLMLKDCAGKTKQKTKKKKKIWWNEQIMAWNQTTKDFKVENESLPREVYERQTQSWLWEKIQFSPPLKHWKHYAFISVQDSEDPRLNHFPKQG